MTHKLPPALKIIPAFIGLPPPAPLSSRRLGAGTVQSLKEHDGSAPDCRHREFGRAHLKGLITSARLA
jgi:hypothetical protein